MKNHLSLTRVHHMDTYFLFGGLQSKSKKQTGNEKMQLHGSTWNFPGGGVHRRRKWIPGIDQDERAGSGEGTKWRSGSRIRHL